MQVKREHSAILSTYIKLLVVIKTFVLSIFDMLFYTGFTVDLSCAIIFAVTAIMLLIVSYCEQFCLLSNGNH